MKRLLATLSVIALVAGVHGYPVNPATVTDTIDYPRYAFNYAVNDPHTHDNKAQWEERDGDKVKGSYSLVEPDGNLRVVEYSSSDLTGFNAVVKKFAPNVHPVELKALPLAPVKAIPAVPVLPQVNSLLDPLTYGLGAASLAIGVPKVTVLDNKNLAWDPLTASYGGWVPLSIGPQAYIFSKKYINGHLHKWATGPISLVGQKLVIRTKKH